MLELWQIILLGILGILVGWINILAGGGSVFSLPVMIFMGIPAPIANGTNRPGILIQNVAATYQFYRSGYSDLRLSFSLSLVACVGALFGALIGVQLEGVWFNRVLAMTMIVMGIVMAMEGKTLPVPDHQKPKNKLAGHALMLVAGVWGGFIQIGIGFILMFALHQVMGLNMLMTNVHKVFIVMMISIVSLVVFSTQVEIYWWAALSMAIGNAIGGILGAKTTIKKGDQWIKRVVYITLVAFVIKLLWF